MLSTPGLKFSGNEPPKIVVKYEYTCESCVPKILFVNLLCETQTMFSESQISQQKLAYQVFITCNYL